MFRKEYAILVEENPQVVWAFISNLPVSLTCHRAGRGFQWRDDPKPKVGSRYVLEQNLLGFTLRHEGRITRWNPPHSFALAHWTPKRPRWGFGHQQRLGVQAVDGSPQVSELRSIVIGSMGPWYVEAPFQRLVRRNMLDHLQALKRAIESTNKGGSPVQKAAPQLAAEIPAAGIG